MNVSIRRLSMACLLPLAIGMTSSVTRADDFAPPFFRGEPLSVTTAWEFFTPPTNWWFIPPEVFSYVGWTPEYSLYDGFATHAEVDDPANWNWTPGDGDGGLTPAPGVPSASIAFKIQNWVDLMPLKIVHIQVTWSGQFAPTTIGVDGVIGSTIYPATPQGHAIVDGGHFWEDWYFHPNPNWEIIAMNVPAGTVLDEIYVDTWSTLPTPGSAAAACMAAAIFVRRRR